MTYKSLLANTNGEDTSALKEGFIEKLLKLEEVRTGIPNPSQGNDKVFTHEVEKLPTTCDYVNDSLGRIFFLIVTFLS